MPRGKREEIEADVWSELPAPTEIEFFRSSRQAVDVEETTPDPVKRAVSAGVAAYRFNDDYDGRGRPGIGVWFDQLLPSPAVRDKFVKLARRYTRYLNTTDQPGVGLMWSWASVPVGESNLRYCVSLRRRKVAE